MTINTTPNVESSQRLEVKFPLESADLESIRSVLRCNCLPLSFNKGVSHVRSIYFDDWELNACQENLSGQPLRWKTRLRWYDEAWPSQKCVFEIKWRKGLSTGKHRHSIHLPESIEHWTYKRLISFIQSKLPADHGHMFAQRCEPIALVEYKREHYVVPDRSIRITLDYDLKFYEQVGRSFPNGRFGLSFHEFTVLEGKLDKGNARDLMAHLYPLNIMARRCSKYVHACNNLELLTGITPAFD